MIRFQCVYCGKTVTADEELIGKKIKCYDCGHSIIVRRKESDDTHKSSIKDDIDTKSNYDNFWEGKSNQEIAVWLNNHSSAPEQEREAAARQALSLSFARFDDLTLFSLSFAFVLVLLMNLDQMKDKVRVVLFVSLMLSRIGPFLASAILGMALSLLSIFVRHEKYEFEKWLMLLFAVLVTTGTGVYSGIVMFKEDMSWLIIFPLWNIINGIILLIAYRIGLLNTNSITSEKAGRFQVVVSITTITLVLILCERMFNLHWAISYSIAVSYTLSLHNVIQDIFGKCIKPS